MLGAEELEKLRRAGKIAAEVRAYAQGVVRENMRIIELCEKIESEINVRGARPAFPVNVCVNEVGAHYTSPLNDPTVIPSNCIVKVDIGVHVDGYIADTAFSMTFNPEFSGLKQAADEALANAIKAIKPKVKVSAVGGIIQSVVERFGFKPIRNLTGHKVLRYMLHAGKFIPNVSFLDGVKIEEGEVYAVEPFVTTQRGGGEVRHANVAYIYRLLKEKPPKSEDAKKFYEVIKRNFASLPFASRWALKAFASVNAEAIFNDLVRQKFVGGYPVLVEVAGQPISQSEHTVLVTKEGCEILTV